MSRKKMLLVALVASTLSLPIAPSHSGAALVPPSANSVGPAKELHLSTRDELNLAFLMVEDGLNPEMMVFIAEVPGERISNARVNLEISGPQGQALHTRAMPNRGGYTAPMPAQRGTYRVTARITANGDTLTERFTCRVN